MAEAHHDIHHEFPEYRDLIIRLKTSDTHFHKLSEQYAEITHKIETLERNGSPESDAFMEDQKKQRLALKDQLFHILSTNK